MKNNMTYYTIPLFFLTKSKPKNAEQCECGGVELVAFNQKVAGSFPMLPASKCTCTGQFNPNCKNPATKREQDCPHSSRSSRARKDI